MLKQATNQKQLEVMSDGRISFKREIHFWQKDHVRLYGLDYPKRLEKTSFKSG